MSFSKTFSELASQGVSAAEFDVLDGGITFPAGHIIKFEYTTISVLAQYAFASGAQDTHIAITNCNDAITPSISGSKILVTMMATIGFDGPDAAAGFRIKRTGPGSPGEDAFSPINSGGGSLNTHWMHYTGNNTDEAMYPVSISWVDTAQDNTTSHVYTLWASTMIADAAVFSLNRRNGNDAYRGISTVHIMEIAA